MIRTTRFIENQDSQYTRYIIEASPDPLIAIKLAGKITDGNEAMVRATEKVRGERSKAEKAMQEIHLFLSTMSLELKKPLSGLKKPSRKQV